jgi:hypothetical protein
VNVKRENLFLSRRNSSLIAALLWGGYALYESPMKARILCSGECNIRIDLVQFFRKRCSDGAA